MSSSQPEKRVLGIDFLRGLCILAVVLFHSNLKIPFQNSLASKHVPAPVMSALFWDGYYGVIVFFVISGFLITTWSLKRWGTLQNLDQRQFYAMRFARIVPCLLGLLFILSLLHLAGVPHFTINPQQTSLPRVLFAALTFHLNWLEAHIGLLAPSWDVLWSLSIEEMFYIFFPLLCWWTRKQWLLITVLATFVVLGPFSRTVFVHPYYSRETSYLSCMDGIALGCLAAIFAKKLKLSSSGSLAFRIVGASLCLLSVAFRSLVFRTGLYQFGLDVSLLEAGAALLVITLQQQSESRPAAGHWSTALVRWFGRNSYEVYLTHMFVVWPFVAIFYYLHQPLGAAPLWFLVIAFVAGVLGNIVARFYSEPLNKALRTKFLSAPPLPKSMAVSAQS